MLILDKEIKSNDAGFTIVELLIVVVIIAILATVTIVTYNGIQQRAYNSQVISGVSQFKKLIESYKNITGAYPKTTPEINKDHIAVVCLGNSYPDDTCGMVTGVQVFVDQNFNNELNRVVGRGGMISDERIDSGPEAFIGAVYGIDFVEGERHARTIQYALKSADVNCQLPEATSYRLQTAPATTACVIFLEETPDYLSSP